MFLLRCFLTPKNKEKLSSVTFNGYYLVSFNVNSLFSHLWPAPLPWLDRSKKFPVYTYPQCDWLPKTSIIDVHLSTFFSVLSTQTEKKKTTERLAVCERFMAAYSAPEPLIFSVFLEAATTESLRSTRRALWRERSPCLCGEFRC